MKPIEEINCLDKEKKISEKNFRKKEMFEKSLQILFVFVILTLALLVLFYHGKQLELLISFTLAGFFPISAIAYLLFQRDTQRRKLARGFWLMGINVRGDLDPDDLNQIETNLDKRNQRRSNKRNLERSCIGSGDETSSDWDIEAYGEYFNRFEERSNTAWNYVAQSIPAVLATMLGLSLFISNKENIWADLEILKSSPYTLKAMQFGFLGAYIFSVQLVYRRYTTFDLQPIVALNCTLTMIAGIVFNFVAFEAINALNGAQESGLTNGVLPIVAFSLGYFPYLAIRWFNRVGYTALGVQQTQVNALPLRLIDGIGQFHETRLRDEGIDNVQNLASVAIEELLINTRFSAPEVIGWVDQAILYLYLDLNDIEIFRRGGIRTFSDLRDYWGPYFKAYYAVGNPTRKLIETFRHSLTFSGLSEEEYLNYSDVLFEQWKKDYDDFPSIKPEDQTNSDKNLHGKHLLESLQKERHSLALQLKTTPDYLDALFLATKTGPNVAYIKHYWKIVEDISVNGMLQKQAILDNKTAEIESSQDDGKRNGGNIGLLQPGATHS